ncbi:flagellar motor protein MotD [Acidithiobacillus thiooxidans]|uniref:flagellar motor protein MotB n=1 Tax=Acidithiobacillus thiooxidans TaxID=930 RepID=UPI0009D9CFDF|nr:flagellar motor protein MotB [Acidithiobacillus thiooxidans]MBU2752805.1 flagellar motor protein MotD [Acidithiobacillus thiooxidans]
MSRRKKNAEEEWENHERWLVSYADFITLLFVFFVVMYSISSVDAGKYKVLSQTMIAAFTGHPWSPTPITSKTPGLTQAPIALPKIAVLPVSPPVPSMRSSTTHEDEVNAEMRSIEARMKALLQPLIHRGSIAIHRSNLGVVVDLNDKVLFPSASAKLSAKARITLRSMALVLARVPYQIQVNGFTNSLPIHTRQFASNWSLSTARAVSVVELFIRHGVNPRHLVAAGYSKYHPIASNKTARGLLMNRRVSVVIVAPQNRSRSGTDPMVAGKAVLPMDS